MLEAIEFDDTTRMLYACFSFELQGKPFDRVHRVYAVSVPPVEQEPGDEEPIARCLLLNSFQGDSGAGIGASYPTTVSVYNH